MIGIIGAMEEEVAALKEAMEVQESVEQASMIFCKGILCGKEAVIVRDRQSEWWNLRTDLGGSIQSGYLD